MQAVRGKDTRRNLLERDREIYVIGVVGVFKINLLVYLLVQVRQMLN